MTETDSSDSYSDEDLVLNVAAAIQRIEASDMAPTCIDYAAKRLGQSLNEPWPTAVTKVKPAVGLLAAIVTRRSDAPSGMDACITWLRKTGEFTEAELRAIHRVGLLYEKETGRVLFKPKGYSRTIITSVTSIIYLLVGIWIAWAFFTRGAGFYQLLCAVVVGEIVAIRAILYWDCLGRFDRIRDKVLSIAPWFVTGVIS